MKIMKDMGARGMKITARLGSKAPTEAGMAVPMGVFPSRHKEKPAHYVSTNLVALDTERIYANQSIDVMWSSVSHSCLGSTCCRVFWRRTGWSPYHCNRFR